METRSIRIEVEDFGFVEIPAGTSLLELKEKLEVSDTPLCPVVGGLCNSRIMGLEYRLRRDARVRFLSTDHFMGADIYRRSLSLLLLAAFIDVIGQDARLKIEHALGRGYYYGYSNKKPLDDGAVAEIEAKMRKLVEQDLPFEKMEIEEEDALDLFEENGAWDRYNLLKYTGGPKTVLYRLCGCLNLAQGPLVPSTGYLRLFSLVRYPPGLVLLFPSVDKPGEMPVFKKQRKLFQIYSEQREWFDLLDVDSAGKLNRAVVRGKIKNLIWLSEGLHEKKIASIADSIARGRSKSRVVFLAGPSSSGKTTFAKRLTIQLLANGISPEVVSLDNFYLPRERMPKNKKGETDFDSLHALDLGLIAEHLNDLIEGKRIEIPRYNFKTGMREKSERSLRLGKDQVVVVEGIHGMNRALTGLVEKEKPLKIYISALTQINLDDINRIPTTTVRLLRRIVRDFYFRSFSARQTLVKWPLVRAGEEKNIFPYQEEADAMFNSSLVYEMSVLKGYVEPILLDIDEDDPVYTNARLLLHFTSNFLHISAEWVPYTSILREFIGGSGFHY